MVNIIRHTVVWTGAPGLPGYSQFYQEVLGVIATNAQSGQGDLHAFFGGLEALIPEEVTVTVDPLYQVLESNTGELLAEATVGSPTVPVAGLFVGDWSARFGVLVEWVTSAIINGRHLRGRTYLVPLGNVTSSDGTLPGTTVDTVSAWAAAVSAASDGFVVWHRPVGGTGGRISTITGNVVRDHPAVLRSRAI